jgi:hypothetical protein
MMKSAVIEAVVQNWRQEGRSDAPTPARLRRLLCLDLAFAFLAFPPGRPQHLKRGTSIIV